MTRVDSPTVLCPSARMKEGAVLLGIVQADGRIAFAAHRLEVNQDFVQSALQGRPAEKRFRFSDVCVQSGCRQWTGERCGVVDQILAAAPADQLSLEMPECSIRPQCRWYNQNGWQACRVCPLVVTDCIEEGEPVQTD
jgi:hypothetical protein